MASATPFGNDPRPPPPAQGCSPVAVRVRRGVSSRGAEDWVADEVPVALVFNGEPHVVMMATPLDLEDFALGFSLSEQIVTEAGDISSLQVRRVETAQSTVAYEVRLQIPDERAEQLFSRRRNLAGRSGCGLCGAETLAQALRVPGRVPAGTCITPAALASALQSLRARQTLNAATGATHAAAWASTDGLLAEVREDVGRHNALDKLLGALARRGFDRGRGFLVITSRASYEMVLKAATLGVPLLAAISAPTAYAIRLAEDTGLTLVGFARGEDCTIYSCPARIDESAAPPWAAVA